MHQRTITTPEHVIVHNVAFKDLTITQAFANYIREWIIPEKCGLERVHGCARILIPHFGPKRLISTITRNDLRDYIEMRSKAGKASATIRKELSFYYAACNHNMREGKLTAFDKVKLPDQGTPRERTFEDWEVQRMFEQPMDLRTWYFLWIDYEAAQRSRAIEQLTVGRVNLRTRLMDFRLPGVNHKKKRRGIVAISDALYPILDEAIHRFGPPWKDDLVIGVSPCWRRNPKNKGVGCTYKQVRRVLERAGLYERWVCRHVGRKTWATNAAIAGATDIEIGNVLQDTPAMVRKHYAIAKPEKMLPVMNRYQRVLPTRVTEEARP